MLGTAVWRHTGLWLPFPNLIEFLLELANDPINGNLSFRGVHHHFTVANLVIWVNPSLFGPVSLFRLTMLHIFLFVHIWIGAALGLGVEVTLGGKTH